AEDGIRDPLVTGVQTCALPICYVDGFVPERHRGIYEKALGALRTAAPHSSSEAIRALVEAELGAPIDELFQSWSDEPFASASIRSEERRVGEEGRSRRVRVE